MDYNKYTAEDFACDESFVRYFLKESNDDAFFWEHWISEHPDKQDEIDAAIKMLNILTLGLPQSEFEEEVKKMRDHLNGHSSDKINALRVSSTGNESSKNKGRFSFLRVAAVLILAITIGAIVFLVVNKGEKRFEENIDNKLIVKSNSNGQKSQLQLSDGSIINLNSNSEVRFLENFSDHFREIELKGEAFFEVARDSERPFIVKTEYLTIKALGTSFNVKAYREAEALKVALVTGKVEINISENETGDKSILTPGEGLTFDKVNNRVTKEKFDPEFTLAWYKGVIYFKNASWKHIEATLEQWYNVQLEVQNLPTTQSLYTGQFDNQSLELVLESLSFSKDFKYKIDGKKIAVYFSQEP